MSVCINKREVRKDIMIMYEAVRNAIINGDYNEEIDGILEKYDIEIDSDGYVIEDEE